MPLYEYQCKACGHRFEALVYRSAQPTTCPLCQSKELERLLSAFAMSGSGTAKGDSCSMRAPSGGCSTGGT
jgi:putative FmdB family regulatory protein